MNEPKIHNLKAVVEKITPRCLELMCHGVALKIFWLLLIITLFSSVAIWLMKPSCEASLNGIYCENKDACLNNPCEGCKPAKNSHGFVCTCGMKSRDQDFVTNPKQSASYALIAFRNGSLAAAYENSTIIIWKDNKFETNTKLDCHNDSVKSLALFGNELLASGSCDSTIKIWNLTTALAIKTLTEHEGCVNALISLEFFNKTYLLSASENSTIKVWNNSFQYIETEINHLEDVTVLAYDSISKYAAIGFRDNKIDLYSISVKLSRRIDAAHNSSIRAICVLKDNSIATASDDLTIKIWKHNDLNQLELITTLTEHQNWVFSLAVLSNGSLISGSFKILKVWKRMNEKSFECVANLEHPFSVTSLAVFSSLVISGLSNGSIYVWNETTLQSNQVLSNHTKTVWSIVALDFQSFASASKDGTIKIWRMQTESSFVLNTTLGEHKSPVYSLVVLKDGRLVSAGYGSPIYVWQKETFKLNAILREHKNTVFALVVLERGDFLSVSADQTIVIWKSDSLTKLESFNTNEILESVAIFSNDTFVTGTEMGSLRVWDTKSIDFFFLQSLQEKHSDSVLALTFMRPEDTNLLLLSGSRDKTIKVWDMQIFKCIANLTGHISTVTTLTPINQKSFASGSTDKSIKIWEYYSDAFLSFFKNVETIKENLESVIALNVLNETKLVSSLIDRYIRVYRKSIEIKPINEFKAHSESVQDIVVLNESSFASCSGDKTIKIWKDSKVVETLEGHSDYVFSLQYSPENHLLISGSKDTTIRLWNTSSSFSLITTMLYHEDSVNSLLFLPNKTFASGSCDKTVIIWKLTTYRMLKSLNKHLDCVNALAIFDSDKYLLTGSTDRAIIIWEISNDYKLSEILRGHQDSVNSLAIYQENIVSASSDKSIIVWSKFKLTFELSAHNGTIWKMCVLSDGLIVSGSYDFEIKIWEKKNQSLKLVAQLTDHKGIIFSLECLKNQSIISSSADKTVKIWKRSDKNYFESVETLEHNDQVTSLTVLSDFIISGEYNGKINVWNESSLELLGNFSSHNNIVWSLVNLNNQSFASASEDTTIKIWEQETYSSSFKCIHNLTDHTSPVWALALLSEKYLISGCNQGLIKIWHLANFTLFKTLTEHRAAVYGFAVLGKESFISVSKDKQTIMWDIENLMKIKALFDKIDVLSVCVLSNDSFATGNSKGTINVWSYFKNFKPIKAISDLKDKVFGLKALNNGLLVSASRNGSLVIWDNSFQSKEIKAHSKAVLALNVFPNDTIISCSEDKTIKTWNTQQYILEKTIY